jgi:chloride channel protein, CIC family
MNMRHFAIPRYHLDTGLLIGVLAGVAGIGFHFLADRFGALLFGWIETNQAPISLLLVILVPTIGLCLVGLILQKVPASTLGGVREVSQALDNYGAVIPLSRVLNVILSGLVLAFGGSVGPEGPTVQMGALIGSKVGQRFDVKTETLKTMVRAGAAAGIAGAFRSPAGGILLAVELFGAHFDRDLPVIGIAAVVGYLTQTAILGWEYPFGLSYHPQPLTLTGLLVIAPLMGLVAAPTGHVFIRMFDFAKQLFPKGWPLAIRVTVGGFLVGCIGIFYPHVMSTGYDVVVAGLDGRMNFERCIVLLLLKMVATSITFGSGAVGGLFAPTLFMGAMFGGAFGFGLHALYPTVVPQPEIYILIGMVVMFGAIVKGYWSGLLLVADMSGCYHMILLPGIIAGGISFLVSWRLHDRSIFDLPLAAER